MSLDQQSVIDNLQAEPVFSYCNAIDIARLYPYFIEKTFKKGEILFNAGEKADSLFLIIEGRVRFDSQHKTNSNTITKGVFGEEIATDKKKYYHTATAESDCIIMITSSEHIEPLFLENAAFQNAVFDSLVNRMSGLDSDLQKKSTIDKTDEKEQATTTKIIGWLCTIILPSMFFIVADSFAFDWKTKIFITIAIATILMWVFRLAHEFIPSIFAVLVILILDIAPPSVALSGFTSGSFFMALSIFGLSAVLISSGLTYRLVITILKILPRNQFWYSISMFITGIFLTPLLPSANGRILLASPILTDMVESLDYKKEGKAASGLTISTFMGFTLFSSVFLSSKSINFVIFGLLPIQVREQFDWGFWFYASLVAGIVLFVSFIILNHLMFRNKEVPRLSKEQIRAQEKILGPMSTSEWAALAGIVLFFVGIATSSIHKIQLPWIGLMVLYVVLAMEFLSKKEFRTNIDWTFLIFLGTLIGFVKTLSFIGLDQNIGLHLKWISVYIRTNFYLFVLILSSTILFMRLFIPNNATVAILASVFLPIAELTGINPWIIGFIILTMSDAWFMPYQSTYYLLFSDLTSKKKLYSKALFLRFNALTVTIRLVAIYASIPFWRYIGIL